MNRAFPSSCLFFWTPSPRTVQEAQLTAGADGGHVPRRLPPGTAGASPARVGGASIASSQSALLLNDPGEHRSPRWPPPPPPPADAPLWAFIQLQKHEVFFSIKQGHSRVWDCHLVSAQPSWQGCWLSSITSHGCAGFHGRHGRVHGSSFLTHSRMPCHTDHPEDKTVRLPVPLKADQPLRPPLGGSCQARD